MRVRMWIGILTLAVLVGGAPASNAGLKELLHPKEKKKKDEVSSLCVKQHAWMAYFADDQAVVSPVRDTQNTENDQDWMGLRFTDFDGPRIRLGVLKVINKSAGAEEHKWQEKIEVPLAGIQELLTVALYNTKRFDVIEQKRIEEVLKQQLRKDTEEPSPSSIVNIGKVLGVQYLVYGTVNEWTPDRAGSNMGPGALFRARKKEAEVAITFALTDVTNGQILFTTAERARMGETSFSFAAPAIAVPRGVPGPGGAPAGDGATTERTPVGYAIQACTNKAAFKIAAYLRNRKWRGSVVDIKGPDIFVNAGSQQGMVPQTKLSVSAVNGIVRDGGTVLGEDLRGIGTLEVVSVQNGFSVAQVVEGCKKIKKGDRVELATPPAPPQVSPECSALDVTTH